MKCTATATLQLLFFLTSSGSWNTQKAISSLEPSSDVDTVTAMGKSETSVGRRSSDEDDDDDDASCEWFSGFSVGERDRRSTFADRSRRSCIHLYVLVLGRIGSEFRAYVRTLCAQLAQTCADIMHVARFRDKIYLHYCAPFGQCDVGWFRPDLPPTRLCIHRIDRRPIGASDRLIRRGARSTIPLISCQTTPVTS